MSAIDRKVNMSLDEIIKMDRRKKKVKPQGFRRRNFSSPTKAAKRNSNKIQKGFVKKRYNKKQKMSKGKNQKMAPQNQGNFGPNRGGGKMGPVRNPSRANLGFQQQRNFPANKGLRKRTSSLPNLRDPTSVHSRLGYQSPAQIAYRNRVKRAKQLLLQRQNQKMMIQGGYRNSPMTSLQKPLTSLQKALEMRHQALMNQRSYVGGMRSDMILRAQRRAQYEQKLMRMSASSRIPKNDVNFMCTLDPLRQRPMNFPPFQSSEVVGHFPRGRSPFRQNLQTSQMVGRSQSFGRQRRSRSRSRSRSRNISVNSQVDTDDRSFSHVMYSLPGGLGVTDKTLNERFSL